MAARVVLDIVAGEPHPVDGLCPACLVPSLAELDVLVLSERGVSQIATMRACADCGMRIPPADWER